MTMSSLFLSLFLAVLALHLGLSMEFPWVTFIGAGLSALAGLKLATVERPTWGLVTVLFAAGGLVGSQLLEDFAVEDSWVASSSLLAGLVLSMLLYLLWRFASRAESNSQAAIDPDSQTILVMGLLLLLLMSPSQETVVMVLGTPVASLTILGLFLASLTLLADRCAGRWLLRALLWLPVFLIVPLMVMLLRNTQGPVLAAMASLIPDGRSNYTSTGFSPNQRLDASVFLRPSTRSVLRLDAPTLPSRYLAGNRLVRLDEELAWQPSELEREFLSTVDAESLATGDWRYEISNHHAREGAGESQSLTVHSLNRDNYIFLNPGTSYVSGKFTALTKNVADVWNPAYDQGAARRWQIEVGGAPTPQTINEENLQLPVFWDQALQEKSQSFVADGQQQTVDNVLRHFLRREYSLQTNFDPDQPLHDFFLNEKAGYCFWYATATTLALRANGIPSRLVSGYLINENISSRLWLVRERDAHSWVEWQDQSGYWHTIDPTPPSIGAFFNNYQSFELSTWYHYLAGQWQILLDRILADELAADLVRYAGLLILAFLFVREYRRIRVQRRELDSSARRWQKLWQRFLNVTKLPANASWTASSYAENLPDSWPESWAQAVQQFLQQYNRQRFCNDDEQAIRNVENALEQCAQSLSKPRSAS